MDSWDLGEKSTIPSHPDQMLGIVPSVYESQVIKMKKKTKSKQKGTWHMGNIALFGAILMSYGITGKEKETLKKLMYEALNHTN